MEELKMNMKEADDFLVSLLSILIFVVRIIMISGAMLGISAMFGLGFSYWTMVLLAFYIYIIVSLLPFYNGKKK